MLIYLGKGEGVKAPFRYIFCAVFLASPGRDQLRDPQNLYKFVTILSCIQALFIFLSFSWERRLLRGARGA